VISEFDETMGNWVGIHDPEGDVTITYWHLSRRLVDAGDRVRKGQRIGIVGSTGNSTAPHLHVQVNRGRGFDYHAHVDPARWCMGAMWWRRSNRRRRGAGESSGEA
jgi:murein DD-endopeptidase MepM/ murein hydrolase activator NlpD